MKIYFLHKMSEFIFVNKNPIIPESQYHNNIDIALSQLTSNTFNKNAIYCKNIYVVELNKQEIVQIFFSNTNQAIYSLNKFNKIKQHKNKCIDLNLIDKFLTKQNFISNKTEAHNILFNENTPTEVNEDIVNETPTNNNVMKNKSKCNYSNEEYFTENIKKDIVNETPTNNNVIKNKPKFTYSDEEYITNEFKSNERDENVINKKPKFIFNDEKEEISTTNEKKEIDFNRNALDENELNKKDVFDDCKLLMNKYNKEIERKNEIREKLKLFEKEEKELLKKQKGLIQDKIVNLYGKFKTYLNIKTDRDKGIIKNTNIFNLEYEYFESMNEDDVNFLKTINDNDIMNKEVFDERLVELSEIFKKHFQKDNKKSNFEHNWSDIEDDVVIGTFHKKCGN
jgi:hypothetical protein